MIADGRRRNGTEVAGLISRRCARVKIRWRRLRHKGGQRMGAAMACSLVLHVLVALLVIFGLPELPPPYQDLPPPIEYVDIGPVTVPSAGSAEAGPLRQEAPAAPQPQPPTAHPAPPAAPAAAAPQIAKALPPHPQPPPMPKPAPKPVKPAPARATKPEKRPTPPDDFTAMLRSLSKQNQSGLGRRQRRGLERPQAGAGEGDSAWARRGMLGIKDFIRAQIEHHWELDVAALGSARLVVTLHLNLTADGQVTSAEIVENPRYAGLPGYRAAAESARRAALVASPLQLPPGDAEAFSDLTIDFNPREAVR